MPHSSSIVACKGSGLVLGVHVGHDRSAALVDNGRLMAHIAEERLDRVKMSPGSRIPVRSIEAVLSQTSHTIHDVDAVGFSFENCTAKRLAARFQEDLTFHFDLPKMTTVPVPHHLAHAWSVRVLSGFQRCAILVCDGAGDLVGSDGGGSTDRLGVGGAAVGMEGESLYLADGSTLKLCDRRLQSFLHDIYDRPFLYYASEMPDIYASQSVGIGRKYEQFTYLLGFGNEQNGKTMGLASYGRPLVDPGTWPVTDFSYSLTLADIIREVEAAASAASMPLGAFLRQHRADAASTVQRFTEEALLGLARYTRKTLGEPRLCVSGGVFLNCVANHKILKAGLFDEVYAMPACGDEGHAIGAAFAVSALLKGRAPNPVDQPPDASIPPVVPYAGISYDRASIEAAIARNGLPYLWYDDDELASEVAALISDGCTVGLLRGRSELGPRALGHRSILADPRSRAMKDHLNAHVKFREAFRPYAPMVLAEHATEIFDLVRPSPFMLLACKVRTPYRKLLPAITHVDGTARVQTVDGQEPFLHALLAAFHQRTGLGVLLNTSFNLAGEPIVESPEDAIRTFLSCGLDALVLEGAVITKAERAGLSR
jgi:carbamoyltransferase